MTNKIINLLARNIRDITYDDVVEFCKQKVLESTQLDYKLSIPKDLAKHFATFSNTQGGLIIIGVGEDDKGLPTTYDGISNNGKLVDRIHQIAANVAPLPTYDVCMTDEQNGKVFILVHIDEGAAPPYTTNSDPTVWIRTGNISTQASREELLRLTSKRREAEAVRSANIAFAEQYFQVRVQEAEQERQRAIQAGDAPVYRHPLGSGETSAILSLTVQPYYPNKQLTTPQELFHRTREYCGQGYDEHTRFSDRSPDTLPGGITAFAWNKSSGHVSSDQLYATGVNNLIIDILHLDSGTRYIHAGDIGIELYARLKITQSYYRMVGYSGLVVGVMKLVGGSGADVFPLQGNQFMRHSRNGKVRLNSYDWSFEIDTATLYDDAGLNQLFFKLIREVSWSLGIPEVPGDAIEALLKAHGWLALTSTP